MFGSKYPTDRTIFFSDAVFAIAMTLLILEVKIPSADEVREFGIERVLIKRIPNLIGFTVSFLVTALFWKAHLQICSLVRKMDGRLLWLNIWLLFFVVLMPFTTAIYSNYGFLNNFSFSLYCINIAVIGLVNYFILNYVIKNEHLTETEMPLKIKWARIRTLTAPAVFMLCIVVAQFAPITSRYGFILIFIFQFIGEQIYQRKLKAQNITTS